MTLFIYDVEAAGAEPQKELLIIIGMARKFSGGKSLCMA
jgi:hypothetical protein